MMQYLLLLLTFALGLAVVSCGKKGGGTRVGNIPPHVRLTGGPVEGDSASYTSEFFWTGWDDDGVIDHYQFTVDIPDNFTLDDINNPNDVGIAWKDTTAFKSRFLFTTPTQDTTVLPDGQKVLPNRFRGNHTIYVRSVDNEGGISQAAYLTFTARTVTPLTTIMVPKISTTGYLRVGTQLNVSWKGEDPDNPDPKRKPKYYEWKLIKSSVLGVVDANYVVNEYPGPSYDWHRVGADTTSVRISLETPQGYVFAVRGIDEAGGVESKFFFGQNAILLSASSSPDVGRPELTVREKTLGVNIFPRDGTEVSYEIPQGKCLRFDFSANAESYGGIIQAFNWGIDVGDPDAEGPNSGFRGWSLIPYTYEPICFNSGIHTVTIKVRDTAGSVTIGRYILTVIPFPLDREVLYVDDYFKPIDPGVFILTDEFIDNQLKNALRASGYDQIHELSPWGIGDRDGAVTKPRLSELASYKFVFWSVLGTGGGSTNGLTALLQSSACATGRILQAYIGAGGSVMIFGEQVFGGLKDKNGLVVGGQCIGTTAYSPDVGLQFGPGDFVCDYLHLCSGDMRDAKSGTTNHGLLRAIPTRTGIQSLLPPVEVDSTYYVTSLGGLAFVDAQFQPVFYPAGGLDTLYTAETVRTTSPFNGKNIAWRYHDPNPVPDQGPVAIFGFPLHRMKTGTPWGGPGGPAGTNMHGLVSAMVGWFKQHQTRAQQYLKPQ